MDLLLDGDGDDSAYVPPTPAAAPHGPDAEVWLERNFLGDAPTAQAAADDAGDDLLASDEDARPPSEPDVTFADGLLSAALGNYDSLVAVPSLLVTTSKRATAVPPGASRVQLDLDGDDELLGEPANAPPADDGLL